MRRLLVVTVLALAACPAASAAPVFVVTGHGWGHGIGLSQYGAYGYALHGRSYEWILDHYYRGTEPGTRSRQVDVILDSGADRVTLSSDSSWLIREAGRKHWWRLRAGQARTLTPKLRIRVGGKRRMLTPPVTARASAGTMKLAERPYRGRMVVDRSSGSLSVVNHVGLEKYLYGVVPSEMPSSWSSEALKAQAVAARTYAVGSQSLRPDTSSQVYGGVWAEDPASTQAVDATRHEIRMYEGAVAQTFFYSSSGGRTAANEDVWGGTPIPYLRSVRDRYDGAGGNPRHNWSLPPFTRRALADELGSAVSGRLRDVKLDVNPSRRVSTLTTVGSRGRESMSGTQAQSLLGLNSTWFRVGVLKLDVATTQVEKRRRVRLTGLARGARAAWLESRRRGGAWAKVRDLELSDGGAFTTRVRPRSTTSYRVRAVRFGRVRLPRPAASTTRTIHVDARAAFYRPDDRSGLSGAIDTGEAGVAVEVQKRVRGAWRTVARTRTETGGGFRAALPLGDGSYRAVVVAADGRVESRTAPLTVVGG